MNGGAEDGSHFIVPNRAERRGYRRKRAVHVLAFDDHPTLDGLEIRSRSLTFGQALDMQVLAVRFEEAALGSDLEREALMEMMRQFGQVVESWNYEDDDGQPVPFTWELLLTEFDPHESRAIMRAWRQATQGVDAPLPDGSADGPPSVEAQIPMDVPSPSLAS